MSTEQTDEIKSYLDWSHEGKPAIWRYLLAVILGFLIWIWGSILPIVLVFQPLNIDPLTNSVAFYYTFITGFIGIPLLVWLILRRPAYSVVLPFWPSNLRDYGLGILIQWIAMAITYILAVDVSYRGFEHITAGVILTVIAALVGVFIQTSFEEMFFRGLVAQATRRVTKWLPVVLGVQAFFFASLHIGNVESSGDAIWKWLLYLTPALTWGWIAWRTGSLVLPMAMHFGNNAFLQLIIGTKGDVIEGIGPFLATPPADNPVFHMVITTVAVSLLTIFLVEVILRRRAARETN